MSRKSSPGKGSLPTQSTNGALPPSEATVGQTADGASKTRTRAVKAATAKETAHQTHGGYTPTVGPISNVHQLTRRHSIAKGSIGSFATVEAYTVYLEGLTDSQLHRHAVEEARIVPIDDRTRLIRRLETEWQGVTAHLSPPPPQRPEFSAEQRAAQEAIRNKLLNRGR